RRQTLSTFFPYTTLFRSEILFISFVFQQILVGSILSQSSVTYRHDWACWQSYFRINQFRFVFRKHSHQKRISVFKPSDWVSKVRSEEHTSELQSRENLVC